jgi:hypothetical protein
MTTSLRQQDIRPTIQLTQDDWNTMEQDISQAHEIIVRYHDEDGPIALYLQEATVWLEGSVEIKQADWVIALQEFYENQYGEHKGNEILRRVLTALITHGFTIH